MKRRLSLVISTIGDPKVMFLDEPVSKGHLLDIKIYSTDFESLDNWYGSCKS